MSEQPPAERPPPLYQRKRSSHETPRAPAAAFRQSSLLVYGVLTAGLVGVALWMVFVDRHPLDSPFVIAPSIGALWFGLRLFMIWGSSNAR